MWGSFNKELDIKRATSEAEIQGCAGVIWQLDNIALADFCPSVWEYECSGPVQGCTTLILLL